MALTTRTVLVLVQVSRLHPASTDLQYGTTGTGTVIRIGSSSATVCSVVAQFFSYEYSKDYS